uniref:Fibronectin type-III domain-containing protein n=1 Tax=Denticeps clupeoides TaxID=299321 RepID=A0AAY3ZZP0_9TELE
VQYFEPLACLSVPTSSVEQALHTRTKIIVCIVSPYAESTPGVLVCVPGSHVILSCHGDVVVDGVLLTSQHAERSLTNPRSTRGVKPVTTQEMGIQADSERASKALELRVSRTTLEENPMTKEEEGSWWTMNGTPLEDLRSRDGTLTLAEIGLANAGNYSCFRSGKRMSTIKITLGVPPQKPGLTCYRTSPNHKIRCEWSFPERLTPAPRCYLLLKKRSSDRPNEPLLSVRRQSGQCSYSVTHNKCWCVLDTKRGLDDNSEYVAQLCVTSTAGNATSPDIHFTATGILKPDPPAQVKVRGVEGGSRMLTVSWSYPASWKQDNFFSLNFQLRYRPVSGEKHQIIDTLQLLSYEILDVIPHTEYELQLRAIEEYHNGMWSDWTSPVYARTWTGEICQTRCGDTTLFTHISTRCCEVLLINLHMSVCFSGAEPTTFYNSLTHLVCTAFVPETLL